MKKLLSIVLLLVSFASYSQVKVFGNITTNGSALYPTHIDSMGYGGMRVCYDTTERNSITTLRRKLGMFVYTQKDSTLWTLNDSLLTNKWKVFQSGITQAYADGKYAGLNIFNHFTGLNTFDSALTVRRMSIWGDSASFSMNIGFHNLEYNALHPGVFTSGGNMAIGYNALDSNGTGHDNLALGILAMNFNRSGSNNTAIGEGALSSNNSGSNNIGLGMNALSNNTIGGNNVGIGVGTQTGANGQFNTVVGGQNSMPNNSFYNTILGQSIVLGNYTSVLYNNILIGDGQGRVRLRFDSSGSGFMNNSLTAQSFKIIGGTSNQILRGDGSTTALPAGLDSTKLPYLANNNVFAGSNTFQGALISNGMSIAGGNGITSTGGTPSATRYWATNGTEQNMPAGMDTSLFVRKAVVYSDPSFIGSLAYSKLTGAPTGQANDTTSATGLLTIARFRNDSTGFMNYINSNTTNITNLGTRIATDSTGFMSSINANSGNITSLSTRITNDSTNTAGKVSLTGSYTNPSWITSLAYSKLTGSPTLVSAFTNDAGYLTSATGGKVNTVKVNTSGVLYGPTNYSAISHDTATVTLTLNSVAAKTVLGNKTTGSTTPSFVKADSSLISDLHSSGWYAFTNDQTYAGLTYNNHLYGLNVFDSIANINGVIIEGGGRTPSNTNNNILISTSTGPTPPSTGTNNVALGNGALGNNTTGYSNTALGPAALGTNTTGYSNIAVGESSGANNTTGHDNLYLGRLTGQTNQNGSYNVFLGKYTGDDNYLNKFVYIADGAGNLKMKFDSTGLGYLYNNLVSLGTITSGQFITSGGTNTQYVMGDGSLGNFASDPLKVNYTDTAAMLRGYPKLTAGNKFTGVDTFYNNIILRAFVGGVQVGTQNLGMGHHPINSNNAFGFGALGLDSTGVNNVAIGWGALANTKTGVGNTAIGSQALTASINGSYNTAIGFNANSNTNFSSGNTVIGANDTLLGNSYNTIIGSGLNLPGSFNNQVLIGDGQGHRRLFFDNTGAGFVDSALVISRLSLGTVIPRPKYVLDIQDTLNGVGIPRFTTAQRDRIAGVQTVSVLNNISATNGTYYNVPLSPFGQASGTGALATVTVALTTVTGAIITATGRGYKMGDTLSFPATLVGSGSQSLYLLKVLSVDITSGMLVFNSTVNGYQYFDSTNKAWQLISSSGVSAQFQSNSNGIYYIPGTSQNVTIGSTAAATPTRDPNMVLNVMGNTHLGGYYDVSANAAALTVDNPSNSAYKLQVGTSGQAGSLNLFYRQAKNTFEWFADQPATIGMASSVPTIFGATNVPQITSSVLSVVSTTKASIPAPVMTQANRDAISSPIEGEMVWNSTTHSLNAQNGTAWVPIGNPTSLAPSIRTVSTNTTFATTDYTLLVDASAGPITITINPALGNILGNIKKIDNSANVVTITAASGTIDGATSTTLVSQWETKKFQSNSTNTYIIY